MPLPGVSSHPKTDGLGWNGIGEMVHSFGPSGTALQDGSSPRAPRFHGMTKNLKQIKTTEVPILNGEEDGGQRLPRGPEKCGWIPGPTSA